jgi:hypothetical protein
MTDEIFIPLDVQNINLNPRPWRLYTKCCLSLWLRLVVFAIGITSAVVASFFYQQDRRDVCTAHFFLLFFTYAAMIFISMVFFIENSKMINHEPWRKSCWPHLIHWSALIVAIVEFIIGNTILSECQKDTDMFLFIYTETILGFFLALSFIACTLNHRQVCK